MSRRREPRKGLRDYPGNIGDLMRRQSEQRARVRGAVSENPSDTVTPTSHPSPSSSNDDEQRAGEEDGNEEDN